MYHYKRIFNEYYFKVGVFEGIKDECKNYEEI